MNRICRRISRFLACGGGLLDFQRPFACNQIVVVVAAMMDDLTRLNGQDPVGGLVQGRPGHGT